MWRSIERALADVARTIVPVECAGCSAPDIPWCDACAAPWWSPPFRADSGAARLDILGRARLPVWSLAPLTGAAHAMIAAWKDAGRRDLDAFFRQAMARVTRDVAPTLAGIGRPLWVIPAPARPASTRRRGIDLPAMLAGAAVGALRAAGTGATLARCLAISGGDARKQSARARWRGAHGSITVRGAPPCGAAAILVDDVLTTGATLAACARALEPHGVVVVTGLTLAAAEPSSRGPAWG